MFDGTQPPKTTNEVIADSLRPQTEIVAYHDSTAKGNYADSAKTITWDAAVEMLGGNPGYNPAFCGSAKYRGLKVTEFTDLGYVGDPTRSANHSRQFSETHAYFDTDFPVKPAGQLDMIYDWGNGSLVSKTFRAGLAKDIKIGENTKLLLECYPLSTATKDKKIENEVILSGSAKINDKLSAYGMGRVFTMGRDVTPVGKIGVSWNINDKWSFKGEYRNWPKVDRGKKGRDSSIYVGFSRRFTGR